MPMEETWFEEWFDSPYYHLLYKHRDNEEAACFIDLLCSFLKLQPGQKVLDAACGKGRHSIHLNHKGLDVTGIDLSTESIRYASQYENETLQFYVHDIRHVFRINYFDLVLNLFTSFGYFHTGHQDQLAMNSFAAALKPGGQLVLDFLNAEKTIRTLIPAEKKKVGDIEFDITREVKSGFITKHIRFSDKGKNHHFTENVKVLQAGDFEKYFRHSGLKILHLFGNYQLEPFDTWLSDRMIFICQKPV